MYILTRCFCWRFYDIANLTPNKHRWKQKLTSKYCLFSKCSFVFLLLMIVFRTLSLLFPLRHKLTQFYTFDCHEDGSSYRCLPDNLSRHRTIWNISNFKQNICWAYSKSRIWSTIESSGSTIPTNLRLHIRLAAAHLYLLGPIHLERSLDFKTSPRKP